MKIIKTEKVKSQKPNKDTKRHTFIEQIYHDNQKENYPKPAPNQYFMDEKDVKKFYKEKQGFKNFVHLVKATLKKSCVPKQERSLMMKEIEQHSKSIPAPGYSQKLIIKPDEKLKNFISYEKQKEIFKQKNEYEKQKNEREQQYLNSVKEKVKFNIKQQTQPQHLNYMTFDYIQQHQKNQKKTKAETSFGKDLRFKEKEREKWQKQIELYNQANNKKIDPKHDPIPGPAAYSLILNYQGKADKKDKKITEKAHNYLSKISKGVFINMYYQKWNQKYQQLII